MIRLKGDLSLSSWILSTLINPVTLLPLCWISNYAPADLNKLTKFSQVPVPSDSIYLAQARMPYFTSEHVHTHSECHGVYILTASVCMCNFILADSSINSSIGRYGGYDWRATRTPGRSSDRIGQRETLGTYCVPCNIIWKKKQRLPDLQKNHTSPFTNLPSPHLLSKYPPCAPLKPQFSKDDKALK